MAVVGSLRKDIGLRELDRLQGKACAQKSAAFRKGWGSEALVLRLRLRSARMVVCVCGGGGTAKLWNSGRNRRAVWSTLVAMEMLGIAFGPKATLMTSKNLCLCV